MPRPRRNITGQVFGRITVLGEAEGGKNTTVHCVCSCGKKFITRKHNLLKGNTRSCGCLRSEVVSARQKSLKGTKRKPGPEAVPEDNISVWDGLYEEEDFL